MVKRVIIAPHRACAGVARAVETVERALEIYGPPIYVRKQIVHNTHVVRDLEARGAIFGRIDGRSTEGRKDWCFRRTASHPRSTVRPPTANLETIDAAAHS